ncbi:homeodomain-like superfamily protein, partial [Striga asiatica]
MPLEGIFLEPCSKPVPDLSLHISPPNHDSRPRPVGPVNEPINDRSSLLLTELSLAHPTAHDQIELQKSPTRAFDNGLRPIKGIPVYPNRAFPFLAHPDKNPNIRGLYHHHQQIPNYSSSSYSSSGPGYFTGGSDLHMPVLNLDTGPSGCRAGGRLGFQNGGHGLGYQYGVGISSQEGNYGINHNHHGMIRSRFMSKIPAKRSMRAPRMRWTSTLHSRFVHAVELLGGHESHSDGSGEDDLSTLGSSGDRAGLRQFFDERGPNSIGPLQHESENYASTSANTLWSNSS